MIENKIIINENNIEDNKIISKFNRDGYQMHPYHLVDNSPWPLFTSFTLFGLTFNTVLTMHNYINGTYIIYINIICLIYSMSLWFRDIISEGSFLGNHTIAVKRGINLGFILFIISEGMFFFGIFWAYSHAAFAPAIEIGSIWPPINIQAIGPLELPLLNTLLLLTSGSSVTFSHHALISGNRKLAIISLILTVILALLFTICQYFEYIYSSFTIADSIYGTTFYMSTGFHGIHVIIGGIMLTISLWRLYSYQLTNTHHVGFEGAILYWHFVDVVWLLLFIIIYWWGS